MMKAATTHPEWLQQFRRRQHEAFRQAGLPTRKNERWKYAEMAVVENRDWTAGLAADSQPAPDFIQSRPLSSEDSLLLAQAIHQHRLQDASHLLVLVNGHFMPQLSDISALPANVIACGLAQALQQHPELVRSYWLNELDAVRYPFAALNAAVFSDGLFLHVPENCELAQPVHLLSISVGSHEFTAHPQHLIVVGANGRLQLVDEYASLTDHPYAMNVVTTAHLEKNARLEYCKIQRENGQAVHLAHHFLHQKQDSMAALTDFSIGGRFARNETIVKLLEQGADCRTAGLYRLRNDLQYIDNHVDIYHAAPRSHSEMLYKGILDKKSRAVFNGRLHVDRQCQKISAFQANHNLLLTNDAEVYSKPELEIYADDVKCKHGATTGQLDQDALFYLRSRGVTHAEAVSILLRGFAEEITKSVAHPGIRTRLQELL